MRRKAITHEFVEFVPPTLLEGTLYVSIMYATAVHLCACGCGNKVVTPISPAEWQLQYDGETVSLTPSIGNWEFPCRSHYWIRRNTVQWASEWSAQRIEAGRARDLRDLEGYFEGDTVGELAGRSSGPTPDSQPRRSWFKQATTWFRGRKND